MKRRKPVCENTSTHAHECPHHSRKQPRSALKRSYLQASEPSGHLDQRSVVLKCGNVETSSVFQKPADRIVKTWIQCLVFTTFKNITHPVPFRFHYVRASTLGHKLINQNLRLIKHDCENFFGLFCGHGVHKIRCQQ